MYKAYLWGNKTTHELDSGVCFFFFFWLQVIENGHRNDHIHRKGNLLAYVIGKSRGQWLQEQLDPAPQMISLGLCLFPFFDMVSLTLLYSQIGLPSFSQDGKQQPQPNIFYVYQFFWKSFFLRVFVGNSWSCLWPRLGHVPVPEGVTM